MDQAAFEVVSYWIAMAGTVAFAVTAVLAVAPLRVDIFGVLVLGIVTAIGGGTLRDIIVDAPVFWGQDLEYIWVALGASLVTFVAHALLSERHVYAAILYADGLGAALFGVQATAKVWHLGFGLPLAPVMLGIITAVGGGLIRDVLAGRQNLLMKPELYAIPLFVGCAALAVVLKYFPAHELLGIIICGLGTFAFRATVIYWNLRVPERLITKKEQGK